MFLQETLTCTHSLGVSFQLGGSLSSSLLRFFLSWGSSRYSAAPSSPSGSPLLDLSTVVSMFGLVPFGSCPALVSVPGSLVQLQGPGCGLLLSDASSSDSFISGSGVDSV